MAPPMKRQKVDMSKESGVYTADMGQPPMDPEVAPPSPPVPPASKASAAKPPRKYAKGGSIDGCAQRGKTKGRYI